MDRHRDELPDAESPAGTEPTPRPFGPYLHVPASEDSVAQVIFFDSTRPTLKTIVHSTEQSFLSFFGDPIEETKQSDDDAVQALLKSRLDEILRYAGYSRDQRDSFTSSLAADLRSSIKREAGLQEPLPSVAPALWRTNKQRGDTPPDFIKRHYGEHLRADGTGLTQNYIKKLDPPLYMGLHNWLRHNQLPSDCPLPTRSQALDMGVDAGSKSEFFRLRSRRARERDREKQR